MASALLLAAGKATRLEGLRDTYAKANVPVGNTTPLRFLLETFGTTFSDVWINLHFKGDQVREQAERYVSQGVRLHFIEENPLLGTGGTLLEMVAQSGGLPEVLVNAKMFTDFHFPSLCDAAPGTLVLHEESDLKIFGGLRFDAKGFLQGLCTKDSTPAKNESAAVFTGICKPSPAWLTHLEAARQSNKEEVLCLIRHGLLPALKLKPKHARVMLHHGTWCEISTPERVTEASNQLANL